MYKRVGMQRMMFVIANTVKMSKHDGRWSPEVKEWARIFMLSHTSENADGYLSQIHTGVVNILAEEIIKKYNDLNLPDWAREILEKLQNTGPEEEQTGGINLN